MENNVEGLPHIHLTKRPPRGLGLQAGSSVYDGPLLVRQFRWILLARTVFLTHHGATPLQRG